jgi:hypothetical protein
MYQAARAELLRPDRRTNPEGTARKWLLSGIARCWECKTPVRSAKTREKFHGYRCPQGHFLRRGELLDQYVESVIVARLSEPDAATLLKAPLAGPDMGTLSALRRSLDEREAHLTVRYAGGGERPLSAAAFDQGLAVIQAERAAVEAQIIAAMDADPLAEVVGAENVRERWDSLPLGRQRAVLDAMATVHMASVGKGAKVRTLDDVPRWLHVVWKTPGRRAHPTILDEGWNTGTRMMEETREKVAEALQQQ